MTVTARAFLSIAVCTLLAMSGCAEDKPPEVMAADGVSIAYERPGSGSPAVIFIHGWANDRSVWRDQLAHFSDKYDVIGIDLPGYGASGAGRLAPTIESYGDDINSVIQTLKLEKVVLVGFSMGALVAVDAAGRYPDQVAGVILVDQLHDPEAKIPADQLPAIVDFYMGLVANPTKEALLENGFYRHDTEESFARIATMLSGGVRPGWKEALIDALTWLNEDCTTAISKVAVPIIAINSDVEPTKVDVFRKYAPSFEAKIIPNTAHLVMWDAPETFNQQLEESIGRIIESSQ